MNAKYKYCYSWLANRMKVCTLVSLESSLLAWVSQYHCLDGQIIWYANGTNKFFDEHIFWYLSVWKDDFSKTICPSSWTRRQQYDINSHQTVKCQTICLSRRFVRPLVWKRPLSLTLTTFWLVCLQLLLNDGNGKPQVSKKSTISSLHCTYGLQSAFYHQSAF